MPTTVVKTIGATGRDYSTLQAWEDACPANLVTADQIWRGECYNDAEFVDSSGNSTLAQGGETTDATRYMELTAAAGQSFQDNAGVRTNALAYNASNGVGIRSTTGYNALLDAGSINFTRISRLQLKQSGTGQGLNGLRNGIAKDLIFDLAGSARFITALESTKAINVLGFTRSSSTAAALSSHSGTLIAIGSTFIRTTDQSPAGTFIAVDYNSAVLHDCCIFGFTTLVSGGSISASSSNNATDLSTGLPGSNNQHGVTFSSTTPFTNSTVASQNSIPVVGTALSANGVLDSTNAPNDITATVRADPPTIGVWELVAAGGVIVPILRGPTESCLVDGRLTL